MNLAELAIDGLAAQECESLAACIARDQAPGTYQDIIEKIRGHCAKLPEGRKTFWIEQCMALGVELFPKPPEPKKGKSSKSEASSTP